jgi:hypothetical protein
MNKEKMNEILRKMAKRMDLVALSVIGLLLAVSVWLYIQEQGNVLSSAEPPAVPRWQVKLPIAEAPTQDKADEAKLKHVKSLREAIIDGKKNINDDESARRLIINNMFDLKSVEEQTQVQKELNERYNLAQKAYDAKQYDEALKIIGEILAKDSRHKNSQELKRRIEQDTRAATPPPAEAPK